MQMAARLFGFGKCDDRCKPIDRPSHLLNTKRNAMCAMCSKPAHVAIRRRGIASKTVTPTVGFGKFTVGIPSTRGGQYEQPERDRATSRTRWLERRHLRRPRGGPDRVVDRLGDVESGGSSARASVVGHRDRESRAR